MQVRFNKDFVRKKNILPATGFEPATLLPEHHLLTGICISVVDHYAPICGQYSGELSRGHEKRDLI